MARSPTKRVCASYSPCCADSADLTLDVLIFHTRTNQRVPMSLSKPLCTITKAIVALMLTAAPVQASMIYGFIGTGSPLMPMAFQLTVPDVVMAPVHHSGLFVFFTSAQFDSSTNCDPSGVTSFSDQSVLGAYSSQLTFPSTDQTLYAFFFETRAFLAPGVYHSSAGGFDGTLTVTDAATEAPELNSTLFVWSGVCLCGLLFRFRSRRHAR